MAPDASMGKVFTSVLFISESNTKISSSDDHLLQTIEDLSRQVYCLPAQNETLNKIVLNVATEIKCNHALLMKRVYDQFLHTVQTRCKVCDITNQMNLPSIRWVLAQIVIKLAPHVSFVSKVKREGTILYRNGDIMCALSRSLAENKVMIA